MASRLKRWLTQQGSDDGDSTLSESLEDLGPVLTLPTVDQLLDRAEAEAPVGDGRFSDLGVLGRGGSAVVRRVFDGVLLRRVALKAFTATSPRVKERFLAEAQITAQLQHPNIVPIHEYGTDDQGRAFISMQLVHGDTLAERLESLGTKRLKPEALDELLDVLGHVCDALSYAHSRGVTHRDLKPSNIMVGSFGQVYLVDWGIAALGEAGQGEGLQVRTSTVPESGRGATGTPTYMPPEQVEGKDGDARTDVYALGGVLYTILTGLPPHQGRSPREILLRAMKGQVPLPSELVTDGTIPPALERIAMRALETDPEDRYSSVGELRAELQAFRRNPWRLPTRSIPAGQAVATEGDNGHEAYILIRGRCVVSRAAQGKLEEIGPGEVFGELAVLTGRPRDATIEALTDVVVQVVSRQELEEGLGLDTWTGQFVRALTQRVVTMHVALGRSTKPDD